MRAILFCAIAFLCGVASAQQCGPGGCTDQGAATQKLQRMIDSGVINRHIGSPLGGFEGIGYSTSPNNIPTCTPRRPMTLTADVVRRAKNGLWVRMRIWR